MTGTQWVLVVLVGWAVVGTVLAAVAGLLLTRVRRRLVWDDTLPELEPGEVASEGARAEQATA